MSAKFPPPPPRSMFCFSHAGGNASEFARWRGPLGDRIELRGVTLPGRVDRFLEPFLQTFRAVTEFACAQIGGRAEGCVLFGHSLGALIAFSTAAALDRAGRSARAVIVSGCPSPDRHRASGFSGLPDSELKGWLSSMIDGGSLSGEQCDELLDLLLPIVRADLRLYDSFEGSAALPVSCPLLAISGRQDPEAMPDSMAGWRAYTSSRAEHVTVEGNHSLTARPTSEFLLFLSGYIEELRHG